MLSGDSLGRFFVEQPGLEVQCFRTFINHTLSINGKRRLISPKGKSENDRNVSVFFLPFPRSFSHSHTHVNVPFIIIEPDEKTAQAACISQPFLSPASRPSSFEMVVNTGSDKMRTSVIASKNDDRYLLKEGAAAALFWGILVL